MFRIVNESTRQPVDNPADRALREGVVVGLANHTVLIAKDGTERPIDDSAVPIRCKLGEIVGCVLVFRDISERHRAEVERRAVQEQIATTLESVTDGFIRYDRDWRIVYVNAEAERINRLTRSEMLAEDSLGVISRRAGNEVGVRVPAGDDRTGDGRVREPTTSRLAAGIPSRGIQRRTVG